MSDDNRILDAAQVRAQCHRVLNGGKPFREEAVSELLDSHEALRAALATAHENLRLAVTTSAEMSYDGRLLPINSVGMREVVDDAGRLRAALATAEAERDAARESREWWRTARSDAISLDLKALVERVGVLEAALRWALDALANDWELGEQYRAARAVLGDQGVPDTETPTE